MQLTSFRFFFLLAISIGIYYIVPKRFQWYILVIFSTYFFCISSALYTGIYLLVSIGSTTVCARSINKAKKAGNDRSAKRALSIGIVINVGILGVLKYSGFFIGNTNLFIDYMYKPVNIEPPGFLAPIGISFYTLQIVGYLLDIFWGISEIQGNILKTALFVGYYPQLTSGPITRYKEVKNQLYREHEFSYKNITFGTQRILWGGVKKLVISSRAGIIVDAIYADVEKYNGLYIWVAAFLFMLQLYTDFSGCMDIVLGASECYGIILPENFRTPFSSRSVQEYWQRWHITLGTWLKDYILYPILRTKIWNCLTKKLRYMFGKKIARQLPSYLGMLCVWLLIGLWHGGKWNYIIGMGLWFWLCIVLEQMMEPLFRKFKDKLGVDENTFSWHLVQSTRVFLLVSVGNIFFRADSLSNAFHVLKLSFSVFNPWIFFDVAFLPSGISYGEINIIWVGIIMLIIVGYLQNKYGSAREWVRKQFLPFRWILWLTLFVIVLIYGTYGPGYDAADFIYGGF